MLRDPSISTGSLPGMRACAYFGMPFGGAGVGCVLHPRIRFGASGSKEEKGKREGVILLFVWLLWERAPVVEALVVLDHSRPLATHDVLQSLPPPAREFKSNRIIHLSSSSSSPSFSSLEFSDAKLYGPEYEPSPEPLHIYAKYL